MTDPLTALRDTPVELPELDEARRATHARIDELLAPKPPRRRKRLPVLTVASICAAATAVVLTTGGSPTTTQPVAATAAIVLREFAATAGQQAQPRLGPGEYYAVRVVQGDADGAGDALDLRYWADADGKVREVGLLGGKTLGTPAPEIPPGTGSPDLRAFPTDDAGVAARMRELAVRMAIPGRAAQPPTTRAFIVAASQMIIDSRATPPAVLRAIFRFLSTRPGMRLIGDVRDPLGRAGKAVAVDGDADHEDIGIELIVDPGNGRPLAVVHYRDGDVSKPWLITTRQEGVVTGTDTLP